MNNIESSKGEIVMYQPDETIRLEVRVEDETVWLTQQQISDLFLRDRTVINRHINNVFKEGECDKESNVHFLHIPNSDKRVMYYSLDVIISVGYRVKSLNGTKFRRWANSILKQYLLKGYAVNQRIFDIEQRRTDIRCLRTDHQPHQTGEAVHHPHRQLYQHRYPDDAQQPFFWRHCHHLHPSAEPATAVGSTASQPAISTNRYSHHATQPRSLSDYRRCGISLRSQPQRCGQETLCLHQDARNTSSNSAERYVI